MVPMTVMIIFILLYLAFRRVDEALLILMSLPFALVGGIWFLYWQGFHMSVATGTGFIALAGVAAEFGVVLIKPILEINSGHVNPKKRQESSHLNGFSKLDNDCLWDRHYESYSSILWQLTDSSVSS